MLPCGIVILAAGESRRLGRSKQLLQFEGTTLLRRCVQTAIASTCRPVIVVTGNKSDEMARELADLPVTIVVNENWSTGIGSSIRAGIAAIANSSEKPRAVCLTLCDQPGINSAAIDRLVQAHHNSGKLITAAKYNNTLGTPAVFGETLFNELTNLRPTEGGKAIIRRHAENVHAVEMPEAALDVDTEADVQRLQNERLRGRDQ